MQPGAQRWEHDLWRGGAWLFGRQVEDYVPPLLSHAGRRRSPKKKASRAPVTHAAE